MLIGKPPDIRYSEITPKSLYLRRREFLRGAAAAAAGTAASLAVPGLIDPAEAQYQPPGKLRKLTFKKSPLSTTDKVNSYEDVTTYNNFYETGTFRAAEVDASRLRPRPWKLTIEGHVAKPGTFDIDEFINSYTLEERIYRLRCVEAWSAVIPWIGIPLAEVIKRVQPTPQAKFVEFVTLLDPAQMPGQRSRVLDWPYIEGLRLDEASHPLAILAVGLYGEVLPNQNGAPIRVVAPWKYGFKSGKSLVKIRFVDARPTTAWMLSSPGEYGFYANVNPEVDHPRWTQARERRLGEFLPRKTLMFNGYGDQVAGLYKGMDLRRNF
jgi:sulfoxide reductase catalytic subunit YedY